MSYIYIIIRGDDDDYVAFVGGGGIMIMSTYI